MGIKCEECNHEIKGKNGLHLIDECPNCGNTQKDKFVRIPDPISKEKKEENGKFLKEHEIKDE